MIQSFARHLSRFSGQPELIAAETTPGEDATVTTHSHWIRADGTQETTQTTAYPDPPDEEDDENSEEKEK